MGYSPWGHKEWDRANTCKSYSLTNSSLLVKGDEPVEGFSWVFSVS